MCYVTQIAFPHHLSTLSTSLGILKIKCYYFNIEKSKDKTKALKIHQMGITLKRLINSHHIGLILTNASILDSSIFRIVIDIYIGGQ